jgi:hypothetical protein
MDETFRLEVATGFGGYCFYDGFDELLTDVENEYGKIVRSKVESWAKRSKVGESFTYDKMYIRNDGI